tara:strand:- start:942 stop:1724 length:783 start_codon:yes stop_codon:yes gene_type:complete
MNFELKGKNAVITGGTHGIGLATALSLSREGCNVAVCSRTSERVKSALSKIRDEKVNCIGMEVDVLNPKEIKKFCENIIEKWGTIHILINNVGGGGRWGNEIIEKTNEDVWIDVYNKNAMAAVRFTVFFLPYFRKQKWGRVVSVASKYGREGGGRPWFNMANSAEISLMKTLSMNPSLVRDGITFNTVAPGGIFIPGTGWEEEEKKDPIAFKEMLEKKFPLGRMGTPEEVANVITFICSDKASLLTGAAIPLDGGESSAF